MIDIIIFFSMIIVAYGTGRAAESAHYKRIKTREKESRHIPIHSLKMLEEGRVVQKIKLASGSVVISVDYFKRVMASFRNLFGGEIASYSSLIDRGRREAVLRMIEAVPEADAFVNMRMETSTISQGAGNSIGSVEFVAYATAITYEK